MSPSRTRTPRRRSARFIETRAALLFISPWIIGFVVFTAWPVINSAYLSLTDYDVINDPNYVGFDNYVQLFEDPKVGLALWNTFVFAVLSVPTHLVVALGLALLLNSASKATGFFRTAFFLPKMTPPVAIGILLLLLFNGQDGLINAFLGVFGIDGPAWTTDPNWVKPALVLMNLWTVGSSVVIILAALRGVPQELYDSALVDGAGWWKRLLRITVPMISPTLFFLFIVDSINALQSFTEAYTAFFGAGNTTYSNDAALFYAIYLFQQAFEFLHMGYASALAWLLFIVIMAITAVQIVVTRRYVHYEGGNP
ncbi:sugar ABC transporter permease [Nonomuraea sp. NPDC049419]|uniref:carbohydrate ABC transporter permease n=1 Tax=Nonomuraea sp. NPDC049419 TaxID=3155772 RepID=UPI003442E455